jgi:prepilin-type processing-associated H-X9-DG protein
MPWRLGSGEGGNNDVNPQRHNLWFQYWWLRDALKTPTILMDPAETRASARVANAWDFSETGLQRVKDWGVAYMLGLDALPTNPRSILLTDRNIIDQGPNPSTSFIQTAVILEPTKASWFDDIHGLVGNVAFADGSIEALNTDQFRAALAQSGRREVRVMKGRW